MRTILLTLAAAFALSAAAAAQCPTVSVGSYGAGCNAAGFDVPELAGGFNTSNCELAFKFSGQPGCCNTFLTAKILMLGFSPAAAPGPGGCTILLNPAVFVFLGPNDVTVSGAIPPTPAAYQVYAQVANQYTTFGTVNDYNLTNGLQIKIS